MPCSAMRSANNLRSFDAPGLNNENLYQANERSRRPGGVARKPLADR